MNPATTTNQDRRRLLSAADVDPLIEQLRLVEAAIADEQRQAGTHDPARPV